MSLAALLGEIKTTCLEAFGVSWDDSPSTLVGFYQHLLAFCIFVGSRSMPLNLHCGGPGCLGMLEKGWVKKYP